MILIEFICMIENWIDQIYEMMIPDIDIDEIGMIKWNEMLKLPY